jgi:micrococcal nuclease
MTVVCLLLGLACSLSSVPISGVAQVTDGDTIRVSDHRIRIQGLDAEELNEPHGPAARSAMVAIVSGHEVTCIPDGTRSYNRVVATCYVGKLDVAIAMVAGGWALDCARYSRGRYREFEPEGVRATLIQKGYCY